VHIIYRIRKKGRAEKGKEEEEEVKPKKKCYEIIIG